jgi:hypothetical protein
MQENTFYLRYFILAVQKLVSCEGLSQCAATAVFYFQFAVVCCLTFMSII